MECARRRAVEQTSILLAHLLSLNCRLLANTL